MVHARIVALGFVIALAACEPQQPGDTGAGKDSAPGAGTQSSDGKSDAAKLPAGDAIATVNGVQISKDAFDKELEKFPEQIRTTPHGRKYVLDNMIEQVLLVAEAEKRGISGRPEFVRMMEDYKRRTLKDMILQELTQDSYEVGDEELKKYFDEHPEQFDRPAMVRASHILVNGEPEAREALKRLKAGEDFKDVAKALSKDPYASATGGDLGWFSKDQRPEYAEQVFALKKPGDLTGPLKTSRGWHVFKLVDRRAPEKKSFEEAKDTLRRRLKSQKRSTAYRDFIAELKKAATIETNEPVLNPGGEGAAQGQPPAGGQDAPAAGQPAAPAPPAAPGGGETGAGGQ